MRMSLRILVAACVLGAGCTTQPTTDPALQPATSTSGEESQQRTRARIHTELAGGYYAVGQNDPGRMAIALEEVTLAQQIDPNYGPAYRIAGLIYASLKQDGPAEANFKRALSINPSDAVTNHDYGQFLCERNRGQEGISYFMAAVKNPLYRTPENSYVNAGACARRMGDEAAAENYFRQALRLRPNQPQALYNLAQMNYERKNYEAAKKQMDTLLRVIKPNAEALWLAFQIAGGLGDAASAASYAQQLRKNFPDSKEARALGSGRL